MRELRVDLGERTPGAVKRTVGALLQTAQGKHRATLTLGHGAGAGMTHASMESIASAFARIGIATLRYNFPFREDGRPRVDAQAVSTATVAAAFASAQDHAEGPHLVGGHSYGGRMASHAVVEHGLEVAGLVFCSFPLHMPKKPATKRADHLDSIAAPMLFLSGTRDGMADRALLDSVADRVGATVNWLETADHGYKVLKRTRTRTDDVFAEMAGYASAWLDTVLDNGTRTPMKLCTFTHGQRTRIGVVVGELVIDLPAVSPDLPEDMISFLAAGEPALEAAREAQTKPDVAFPVADVVLEAPVPMPGKILAIGLNYADHIAETGAEPPKVQMWFNKQHNAANRPYGSFNKPAVSDMLDYEGELAFVIGKRAKHVPKERAHEVIAGYCCGNDVSVRDWQSAARTMQIGKSFDTHAPFGPWIVTPDEVGDPHKLGIRTLVNDEMRQNSNTEHLIFDCFDHVEHLTKSFTLDPGDVIFTGTSSGVAAAMNPPAWLKVGDEVRIEIENIGYIEHTVVEEDASTVIG